VNNYIELDNLHIWIIDLNDQLLNQAVDDFSIYSENEILRYKNLIYLEDKNRYLTSRFLLRNILSKITNIASCDLVFKKNNYNKPYLSDSTANLVNFNISHSGNKLAIIIGNDEVGIDIEYLNNNINITILADLVFSQYEATINRATPRAERLKFFYKIWTRKEALFKCIATGINNNFNKVTVINNAHCAIINRIKYDNRNFILHDLDIVGGGWYGCLAYMADKPKKILYHDMSNKYGLRN
jgi:4'-phosphopantetheinyl transferase